VAPAKVVLDEVVIPWRRRAIRHADRGSRSPPDGSGKDG
jgi:hypothetical protein